ncbi:MAG: class I SAM-dependent methyltransferase [Bacteroidota bacterium]
MKDLFSGHASDYARYRPTYPESLYRVIVEQTRAKSLAWDTGTGNGQAAVALSRYFEQVHATDISATQLANAQQAPNITYRQSGADASGLPDRSVDLITAATAVHWFDTDTFYHEVDRVAKPGAVIAVWCHGLCRVNKAVDALVDQLYHDTLDGYWEVERGLVDAEYRTLPFPYREVSYPAISMIRPWDQERFLGYLNTWSAIKTYVARHGSNPMNAFQRELQAVWPAHRSFPVIFELYMRLGRV